MYVNTDGFIAPLHPTRISHRISSPLPEPVGLLRISVWKTVIMDDLQQIIPEGFKASFTSRKTYITFGSVIVGLGLVCIILTGLLAHSMAKKGGNSGGGSRAGGSAAAMLMGGAELTPEVMETAAWMGENIDPTVDRCENFYKFACGGWEDNHFIRPDRSSTNIYTHLRDDNEEKLREIIESPIQRNTPSSTERKLKDFFKMCLHDYGRMREGGTQLVDIIRNDLHGWYVLDPTGWSNNWDIQRTIARLQGEYLVSVFFNVGMTFDPADHKKNIMSVSIDINDIDIDIDINSYRVNRALLGPLRYGNRPNGRKA